MNDVLDVSNVISSFKAVSTNAQQMIPTNPISAIATGVSNLGTSGFNVWNNHIMAKVAIPLAGMNLAGAGIAAAANIVGTILHDWHERKMQVINNKHQELMQKEENRHNEAVLKEQYRHEEYMISEQRKVLEKILEVSLATYNKKAELLTAQMNCIESTYQQELRLINENISFLEHEKVKIKDNMELYMELTRDIRERYKTKDELIRAYNEAHVNLTTAMKCLELEKPLGYNFQESAAQLKMLGGK